MSTDMSLLVPPTGPNAAYKPIQDIHQLVFILLYYTRLLIVQDIHQLVFYYMIQDY